MNICDKHDDSLSWYVADDNKIKPICIQCQSEDPDIMEASRSQEIIQRVNEILNRKC